MAEIVIHWTCCESYDGAKNHSKGIYLHESKDGKALYWGKVERSVFGGNSRVDSASGKKVNPRYAAGYRHWIDACLEYGSNLYTGEIMYKAENVTLDDIECFLIYNYGHKFNRSVNTPSLLSCNHTGTVPKCIKEALPTASITAE